MAVAIAWLPGPAGTRRRVAKLSVEEPDAAEPARPDLWGARVSNDPCLPDRASPRDYLYPIMPMGQDRDADRVRRGAGSGPQDSRRRVAEETKIV